MDFGLPVLFVLALWWLSTVVLLHRAGLAPTTFRATLIGSGVAALAGIAVIVASRDDTSALGAYFAFTGALAIWALHEVSYLLGFVSGPRAGPCPSGATIGQRFGYGIRACLYHELAVVGTAAVLAALTWRAPNTVALWTFVVLWLMRWSAKLNIFLGVSNLHRELWPEHLQYLQSYARERRMNALFPWSMLLSFAAIAALTSVALAAGEDTAQRAGAMLLLSLVALATLEHVFLMLRVPDDRLWRLGSRSRERVHVGDVRTRP